MTPALVAAGKRHRLINIPVWLCTLTCIMGDWRTSEASLPWRNG